MLVLDTDTCLTAETPSIRRVSVKCYFYKRKAQCTSVAMSLHIEEVFHRRAWLPSIISLFSNYYHPPRVSIIVIFNFIVRM